MINFENGDNMDVRNNVCNQVWNVTSIMTLTVCFLMSYTCDNENDDEVT